MSGFMQDTVFIKKTTQKVTLAIDGEGLQPEHFQINFAPECDNSYFINDLSETYVQSDLK